MRFTTNYPTIDLDGTWSFTYAMEKPAQEFASSQALQLAGMKAYPCTVPGNFELDLEAIGVIEAPYVGMNILRFREFEQAHVWYYRSFTAGCRPGFQAVLVFEGLDCYADVYLNGQLVAQCDNMLVPQEIPVDALLSGENELLVHISPAVEAAKQFDYPPQVAHATAGNMESLYVRKAAHMYGWDIMPRAVSAGIWRSVSLQYRPLERLERVYLETQRLSPEHDRAELMLTYRAEVAGPYDGRYRVALDGRCGESTFQAESPLLFAAGRIPVTVTAPMIWWPRGRGDANLYDVTVRLLKDGNEIDRISFTHGIRTTQLIRTGTTTPAGEGEFCFIINGEKVFVKGSNWVPADAFHSRDLARIPQMLALAEELECNLLRCWGGNVYEADLFYQLCDEKGIMIWQDFGLACAMYPQDAGFQARLAGEVTTVVQRLRQHPCIVLWAGDNECDQAYNWFGRALDPNDNVLTREVIPRVLRAEDPSRPYIPSSPYIDRTAFAAGEHFLTENHLWGPRDYYKSPFYLQSLCHFVSEIGYHGCPERASLEAFLSPEKLWPYQDNEEWDLHSTCPHPTLTPFNPPGARRDLMGKQVGELFGRIPDTLDDFIFASQAVQAEAKKFFVEFFRGTKWRRTGIIWWNLIDGWPQFSDAVVDYYFRRKLAFDFIKTAQQPVCVLLREPVNWQQELVVCNDTRNDMPLRYSVQDIDTGEVLAAGEAVAWADQNTVLARIHFSMGVQRFYLLRWSINDNERMSHYLAGNPPFHLDQYRDWLQRAGLLRQAGVS